MPGDLPFHDSAGDLRGPEIGPTFHGMEDPQRQGEPPFIERLFEGPLLSTLAKLAIISFSVGILVSIVDIDPLNIWGDLIGTIERVWNAGFRIIGWALDYLFLGAIIVVPIWLVMRIWGATRGGSGR